MKILVAYMSETGNTKKVAESIFEEITCDREIKELKHVEHLEGYDLSFIGFPIHAFGPPEPAGEFLKIHAQGKAIALFITHAAPEDSEELVEWLAACKAPASGADLIDTFHCQGELARDIMEALKQSNDPKIRSFGELGPQTKGQPDEMRLNRAKEFAREIIAKQGRRGS